MAFSARRDRAGFTTIELLIGVVIVGIIAALAIPSFKGYVYRSRVSEAVSMLNEIKARQESYRAKYGQYCAINGTNWGNYNPTALPGVNAVAWPTTAGWEALGVTPPGPVRFQYATIAGGPGDTPPASSNMDDDDFWYAAQARGDLDGDGVTFILEVYSQSPRMYNSAQTQGGYE
jgi:prepilin-type N-terminal cleavage/methylation domain-containing protein